MHLTLAWHEPCQLNEARLDRGWGPGPLRRLRPAQVPARSREGVHAHAVRSRAGSGLSGGKSREIRDWDDSREEGSGVGEGGEPGQRPGSLASGLGEREGGWQRE